MEEAYQDYISDDRKGRVYEGRNIIYRHRVVRKIRRRTSWLVTEVDESHDKAIEPHRNECS